MEYYENSVRGELFLRLRLLGMDEFTLRMMIRSFALIWEASRFPKYSVRESAMLSVRGCGMRGCYFFRSYLDDDYLRYQSALVVRWVICCWPRSCVA